MGLLIKSANLLGVDLLASDRGKLGAVREVFVDVDTGRAAFLIVEGARLLGGTGKFHPVPWEHVAFDPEQRAFRAELTKDALKASPAYDREQLNAEGYGWDEQSRKYFQALGGASAAAPPPVEFNP